jgi:hypothetical protein
VLRFSQQLSSSILTVSWNTYTLQEDDYFLILPAFDNLIATLHVRNEWNSNATGCTRISWSSKYKNILYSEKTINAWLALDALVCGRLVSSDAASIADGLRDEKHANPMIGIVCAYLYDSVGDSDSLSRLCHFYVQHRQGIPFDLALLSGGRIRKSEKGEGWEITYAAASEDKERAVQHICGNQPLKALAE